MALKTNDLYDEAGTGAPDFPAGMPTVEGVPIVESGSNSDGYWQEYSTGWGFFVHTYDLNVGSLSANGWTGEQSYVPPRPVFGSSVQGYIEAKGISNGTSIVCHAVRETNASDKLVFKIVNEGRAYYASSYDGNTGNAVSLLRIQVNGSYRWK